MPCRPRSSPTLGGASRSAAVLAEAVAGGRPVRSTGGALKHTYALFAERVPAGSDTTRPDALTELVLRYFTSRGPATVKDCAGWSGLTVTDVRRGVQQALDAHPGELATVVIDGGAPAFPFEGEPMHVVLLDGRMAGSWRHTLRKDRCELDIRLAGPAADGPGSLLTTALEAAVDRYERFIGVPVVPASSATKLG